MALNGLSHIVLHGNSILATFLSAERAISIVAVDGVNSIPFNLAITSTTMRLKHTAFTVILSTQQTHTKTKTENANAALANNSNVKGSRIGHQRLIVVAAI